MNKGRIKNNGKHFQIEYEKKGKKKTITIPPHFLISQEHVGKEIDFDNSSGPLKKIFLDGTEIKSKVIDRSPIEKNRNRNNNHAHGRNIRNNEDPPKPSTGYSGAPYNFIPLNEFVIEAEHQSRHNIYERERYSGYLDYNIKALTPIYIRGENSEFFGPNNQKTIPGSTTRGMIRTLTEIITYSKLEFTDKDKLLYYRDVAKGKDNYRSRLKDKLKAGWVRLKNRKIELCAATNLNGAANFMKIKGEWNGEKWKYRHDSTYEIGEYKKVKFSVDSDRNGRERIKINVKDGRDAVLYITGKFQDKKKRQYIIGIPSETDIKDITKYYRVYCGDNNREITYDLTKRFQSIEYKGEWLPIFYIEETGLNKEGEVEIQYVIGDTLMFRLPYLKKIKDFIPDCHQNKETNDMTNSIFGNVKFASKVYFEDARMVSGKSSQVLERLDILNSPKPTTYQHYLLQDGDKLATYNSKNTTLNGYKMYWHRSGAPFLADPKKYCKNPDLFADPIKKVEKESVFHGRIRFDNLTRAELGALVMAIDLPDGCGHRLGLGKPHGLGSIRMENIKISNIDREARYSSLFDNGAWCMGVSTLMQSDEELKSLKMTFLNHLNKSPHINFSSIEQFWEDPLRMSHLKKMLKYEDHNNDWIEKTRYMEIEMPMYNEDGTPLIYKYKEYKDNEYKDRPKLRLPNDY